MYLISCKYGVQRALQLVAGQRVERGVSTPVCAGRDADWFATATPGPYAQLWSAVRAYLDAAGCSGLPIEVDHLTPAQRSAVRRRCPKAARGLGSRSTVGAGSLWPRARPQRTCGNVRFPPGPTARKRRGVCCGYRRRPISCWCSPAKGARLAYRVGTPWDLRQAFEFRGLTIGPRDAGQPVVDWSAQFVDRLTGQDRSVEGHVEVRWSHGRFGAPPEAKVYLDTPHHLVPGYVPVQD